MGTVAQSLLAIVLVAAAAAKLRDRERSAEALATYGIAPDALRRATLWAIVAIELALCGALLADAGWAAGAACGVFGAFALAGAAALAAGRGGRPCACFGATARLSRATPAEAAAAALLAAAVAAGWLPVAHGGYTRWLTVGLTASLAGVVVLAAVLLALAREIGVLRMSISGQGALEIPDEGPLVGERQSWAGAVALAPGTLLALAVFSSEGCPICRRLEPAVKYLSADPLLSVRVFDETADAAVWSAAQAPGSPYAVALDAGGVALAKGTFNSLAQLESIVATALTRETQRDAVAV
jgi:hypothetical protein